MDWEIKKITFGVCNALLDNLLVHNSPSLFYFINHCMCVK